MEIYLTSYVFDYRSLIKVCYVGLDLLCRTVWTLASELDVYEFH